MQSNVNPANCSRTVAARESQKRIKRRGGVRIQQRFAQTRPAYHAPKEGFLEIPGITETRFPVPRFEIIAKFAQLAAKSRVEQHVLESSFDRSDCFVVNCA